MTRTGPCGMTFDPKDAQMHHRKIKKKSHDWHLVDGAIDTISSSPAR